MAYKRNWAQNCKVEFALVHGIMHIFEDFATKKTHTSMKRSILSPYISSLLSQIQWLGIALHTPLPHVGVLQFQTVWNHFSGVWPRNPLTWSHLIL